jgi:hypothetical protein
MLDEIGNLPTVKTEKEALREILWIARDPRDHVMLRDSRDWLALKLKAIEMLVAQVLPPEAPERDDNKSSVSISAGGEKT